VHTFVAKAQANVGDGQTLVTGGWPTTPGKRALFLVTPQVAAVSDGSQQQITFSTVVFEAAEEVLASLGMDSFKADSKESSLQGVLTAAESGVLLKALKATPGVDVLSAPRVITLDGRQAQIQDTQLKTVPGCSEPVSIGPMINLLPRLSEDHKSVEVTVQVQLNLPNQPSP
jgi:type II secretory pathway component GspD/PulD (secretin)